MIETTPSTRPSVIIVGAGPSGLALAIELGSRSIPCLILERGERVGYAPRAKTTHTRTREHLRRWGIADRLAEASPFGVKSPSTILFVTRLAGHELTRFENAFSCKPGQDERYAEHAQWVPQYKLEQVLRDHALSLPGVSIAYGREFTSFDPDEAGVAVQARNTATEDIERFEADYLVGADGARSAVREAIGAQMKGQYGLGRYYNTIFRAPGLRDANPHGDAIMIWQINPEVPSVIGPMDQDDLWYFSPASIPEGKRYTNDEMVALIEKATGVQTPIEILSSDEWVASTLIADKYTQGRAFLIGDACHLHPPFGGYGMNMGVGDAVDLGWKLTATIQGWGGPGLLASYEAERRPTHEFVIAEAAANHSVLPQHLLVPQIEAEGPEGAAMRQTVGGLIQKSKSAEFHSLGVSLGYRYEASPIIAYEVGDDWAWSRDYAPSATPGSRAPHHWLGDGQSLYDTFGPGFTLLVLKDRKSDIARADAEARSLGAPLQVVRLDDPVLDALYEADLVLIRPDQHVAWRGETWRDGVLSLASGHAHGQDAQARVA